MKRYAYANLLFVLLLFFLFVINFFVLAKTQNQLEEYKSLFTLKGNFVENSKEDKYIQEFLKFKEEQKQEIKKIQQDLTKISQNFEPKKIFENTINKIVAIKEKNTIIGNGVMISDSMVLTNYHVVNETKSVNVTFYSGIEDSADLIIFDKKRDLAVFKTKNKHEGSKISFSKNQIYVGNKIVVIGSTLKLDFTMSSGIISALRTSQDGIKYIQFDAPTNVGNSGSPLLNSNGELIGIITLKATSLEGVSFAIHLQEINEFLQTAIVFV